MPLYKVDIHYNRPMHGQVYLNVKEGEEVTRYTAENFLIENIECLNLEEDYHTDHEFYIEKVLVYDKYDCLDIWNIDAKTGESIDNDDYEKITKGDKQYA